MPIYEYACRACGHEFELMQKINEAPISSCPECNHLQVEKLVSMSSFKLKGGGWYADGYASVKGNDGQSKEGNDGQSKDSQSADSKSSTDSKGSSDSKGAHGQSEKTKATKKTKSSGDSSTKAA